MRKVELSAVTLPLFKKGIINDDLKAISAQVQSRTEPPIYDMKAVTKNKA